MIFGPIRVAAVDDDPAHLLAITSGLAASGLPCAGYWYDRGTGNLSPAPAEKLTSVRLIFMDLNLAEIAGGPPDTASLCATVMEVLEQLLSKDAGPYLLVFWTNVSGRVEDVADMLYQRLEAAHGVPCPLAVGQIAKGPFIVSDPNEKDFKTALLKFHTDLHAKLPALAAAVSTAVGIDPQLNLLCAWETRAADAAALTVNEVHRCARSDEPEPSKVNESLTKVAAKIALAAAGSTAAQTEPARALDAGMLDILVDQFGSSVDALDYKATVTAAIGPTLAGNITFGNSVAMHAELNTFFHVDREVATVKSWDRGVVVAVRPPLDGNVLGFKPVELLTSEFLFPHELFPEARHAEIRVHIQQMRQAAGFVLIEMGADCDHAQDHDRTRRFLVGLEIPEDMIHLATSQTDGKLRNGALELLGPWSLNGTVKYLLVSCRRFWTWQKRTPPPGAPKYRLRAQLVDKLLHRYSTWSSRPGIVEFR